MPLFCSQGTSAGLPVFHLWQHSLSILLLPLAAFDFLVMVMASERSGVDDYIPLSSEPYPQPNYVDDLTEGNLVGRWLGLCFGDCSTGKMN